MYPLEKLIKTIFDHTGITFYVNLLVEIIFY